MVDILASFEAGDLQSFCRRVDVFELGKRTVEANKASVIELGKAAYELTDFNEILQRAKSAPADKFVDQEELLDIRNRMIIG